MFHLIFEHYGYTCEEVKIFLLPQCIQFGSTDCLLWLLIFKVFYQCYQSGVVLNCCDFFYFTYVMLRARCLRLGTVFQNDNEEVAKLSISFRNIPSPLCSKTFHQVIFVGVYIAWKLTHAFFLKIIYNFLFVNKIYFGE